MIGYSTMLEGITIKYSSLVSYDGTQIAIMIVEPDEDHTRFTDQKYGVVVAHGVLSKAESNLAIIAELARAGFTVVALDERGHGNSGGTIEGMQVGLKEYQDVTKCAEYLRDNLGCSKVSLIGHSLGGIAVSMAAIWGEKQGIINVSSTISISAPYADSFSQPIPEAYQFFLDIFSNSPSIGFSIYPYGDEFNESGAPYNFLSVISEGDEIIEVEWAETLCNLAGGPGHTSDADFLIGNASDLLVLNETTGAPRHGGTTRHPLVVKTSINWIERSMNITNHYIFNEESYQINLDTYFYGFQLAHIGLFLLLLPLYSLVKEKILIINHKRSVTLTTIEKIESMYDLREFDSVIDFLNDFGREYTNKQILVMLLVAALSIFVAPFISALFGIPALQTYAGLNLLFRDLSIAGIIFILIFFLVLKYVKPKDAFNKLNAKKFIVSSTAAAIMLFVYIIGMMLFNTYYDINNKWFPFVFDPFIAERFWMFITFVAQMLFSMAIVEYFCRVLIQVNLFNSWREFSFFKWLKITIFNGLIKAVFASVLIMSIYIASDPVNSAFLFEPNIFSIYTIFPFMLVIFIGIEGALTVVYQNSKDFWFVTLACYFFLAWFIASWLIRI